MKKSLKRCPWPVGDDALYLAYHDKEWGRPVRDDGRIYEFLVLESFQAGLSWRTILYKRENFRKAFAGFDYKKVARFGARDRARVVRPARPLLDEQPQRAVVLDARRRPRGGVAVRVDALDERSLVDDGQLDAFEPAAILRRSRALSSVSSSTPCSRATSCSVRPEDEASLTISAARS